MKKAFATNQLSTDVIKREGSFIASFDQETIRCWLLSYS